MEELYNIFNVRQRGGEALKDYLSMFCAVIMNIQTHDDEMMVVAFVQGITAGLLSDSLIRNLAETFSEVRERVVAHIEAEEIVLRKNGSSRSKQPRSKEFNRDWSLGVNETSIKKRTDSRYVPYVAKRDEPKTKVREGSATRPKFRVSYKELLSMLRVTDKLKFPQKIDRFLGSRKILGVISTEHLGTTLTDA